MDFDLSICPLFENDPLLELSLLPEQGYCNINYLAITQNTRYLVRKLQPNHIDRTFEYRIQKKAYGKHIAGKPFCHDEDHYIIISEFLEGRHKQKLTPRDLRTLASTLQKMHKIRIRKKRYHLKKDFKSKDAKAHKALRLLSKIPKDHVLTHHDLNPKNILFHNQRVKFIDWEYTGINDRYFDLATIAVEFKLMSHEEHFFLRSYFKNSTTINFKKLYLYKELYTILCAQWFKNLNLTA